MRRLFSGELRNGAVINFHMKLSNVPIKLGCSWRPDKSFAFSFVRISAMLALQNDKQASPLVAPFLREKYRARSTMLRVFPAPGQADVKQCPSC